MFQTDSARSLFTPSLSPPHLLTQRFEVQGFQFLRHLFPPVAEPAVKVGRLEEMPLNLRRRKKGVHMTLGIVCIPTTCQ